MVVALACECCCYQYRKQQDMERICAFDWSSTDIHLAVSSSTSSGGGHKNCPQASMTCCSLWARALTLKAYLLPAAVSSRARPAKTKDLAHGLRECLAHGLFSRVLFSLRAILIRMLSRAMMSWCDVVLEQIEAVVVSSGSSKKYQ